MKQKKKFQKSSDLLSLYSQKISSEISQKASLLSFGLNFKKRSPHVAQFSGYVIFQNYLILDFNEILKEEKSKILKMKYRYHLMNKEKNLIFRYDNVAHFPKLKTHPHHKHLKDKVIESTNPALVEILEEIELMLIKNYDK